MRSATKTKQIAEFGDFQTPEPLAREICALLTRSGVQPNAIVEPTCGVGNILSAAVVAFPLCRQALGLEISPAYVAQAQTKCGNGNGNGKVNIKTADFLQTDWQTVLKNLPEPLLVIGNPPWVTNSQLSLLQSSNVPQKSNFQRFKGFAALTGKSNFDLSEWMLLQLLHRLNGRKATLAMLCKTTVARKLLAYAWRHGFGLSESAIYRVDAAQHFGAAVDACLLVCRFAPAANDTSCAVFAGFDDAAPSHTLGYRMGQVVTSLELYERWQHLQGNCARWRSGVKHDCAKVMELTQEGDKYRNGFGDLVSLEDECVYPLFKSSDLANGTDAPRRWVLVTQKAINQDTAQLKETAPHAWAYLEKYGTLLDGRGSVIYNKRPRFAMFGVGDYSFTDWKVAISGFYKKLQFRAVGPYPGRPVLVDDTAYFIPCADEKEAAHLAALLNSNAAREFFAAFICWDAKRPITIDLLRRLDLAALARELSNDATTLQVNRTAI